MTEFAVPQTHQPDHRTPLRWVYSYISRQKLLVITLFIGAFGNAALAAIIPVLIGIAFDAAKQKPANLHLIGLAALWILISQVVRAFLQLGRNFSSEVLGQRLERATRNELYVSLLGKSMTFHDLQPVGDTMARATNDVREVNRMFNPGINLVVGSANFIIMPLILAPRYNWALIAAPLFFIVTYFWALKRYLLILSPITDKVRLSFGTLNSRLAEAIDGIETVKGAAQEEQEIGLFEDRAKAYRDYAVKQGYIEANFLPLLLLGLTQAFGFAHSFSLYLSGRIAVGDVVAYMGLLNLFGFPTFISLTAYSQVALGLAGAKRILGLINQVTELDENKTGHQSEINGDIRFENVTFGYVDGTNVLTELSFTVKQGQTVAIVGQTGAGKSTIAKLINRTYDIRSGRIMVDGVDVRDWQLDPLRRQISIIEQEIFLFSRTIAENIAFGYPDASQTMIEEAAKAAQAHDFILTFKDGYQTVVGERGVTLSGGQRQRIALARAFLSNPRILILDDSTSAVDSATEDKIQQAISQAAARQTTILITHRLSQIRWADQVILLRRGRLVAVGNHDSLMADYPGYRRIFEQYEG